MGIIRYLSHIITMVLWVVKWVLRARFSELEALATSQLVANASSSVLELAGR